MPRPTEAQSRKAARAADAGGGEGTTAGWDLSAAAGLGAQDGRLSNVELAKRVGLTPPPCLRRVKRLEEAGVITGYRAVIDPAALGRELEVLIDVEIYAQDRKTVEEFETTVASYEEVIEFRRMYGPPDDQGERLSDASQRPTPYMNRGIMRAYCPKRNT